MAKPTGSKCNIDCHYCFYLEKEQLYPERGTNDLMSDATLLAYVEQHIEAQQGKEVVFAWQGGEPTLRGINFYRQAVKWQQQFANGKKIINTFQTNGLLVNDEWCVFFKEHHFLIGISIDGPAELHDQYRVTRSGKPTHQRVVDAISLLKKYDIEFNTLTVVNDINVHQPLALYTYLKELGSQHMQFLPAVEQIAHQTTEDGLTLLHPGRKEAVSLTDWSVKPVDFGAFLVTLFHHWVRHDIGNVWVQMFENAFALTCDQPAQMCIFAEHCGSAFALESNGDIYQCDHYVYPEFTRGNIHHTRLKDINTSEENKRFALNKAQSLSSDCQQCDYRSLCHGGCPKQRFSLSSARKPEQHYLCQAYKQFFAYSTPYLQLMKKLLLKGHPPAAIMTIVAKKEAQRQQR